MEQTSNPYKRIGNALMEMFIAENLTIEESVAFLIQYTSMLVNMKEGQCDQ